MVTRAKGPRQNTRHFMRKRVWDRGRICITAFLQKFSVGDKVLIKPDPSVQKGIPSRRFFNKVGTVSGERGKSYVLTVKDGRAKKTIIVPPVHLRKLR